MSTMIDADTSTTPTDLIALVRETAAAVRAEETKLIVLAATWADVHPDLEAGISHAHRPGPGTRTGDQDQDPDQPEPRVPAMAMAWDAGAPFAAAIGFPRGAGQAMIRDALVLRHLLPGVWERVLAPRGAGVAGAADRAGRPSVGPTTSPRTSTRRSRPSRRRSAAPTLERLIDEAMLRIYFEERELAQLEALDVTARHPARGVPLTETGVGEMTIRADWKDLHDL